MRVAVLGAGLQGVCVALELARHGIDVVLIDQDQVALNRASLRNEGKIHLGLVYANDPTFASARSMLQGALSFGNLINRWTRDQFDQIVHSSPFWYLVARDSLLSVAQLREYYHSVQNIYEEDVSQDRSLNYLGSRPARLGRWLQNPSISAFIPRTRVEGGFATVEVAIDLMNLVHLLRKMIAEEPRIQFLKGHQVKGVSRHNSDLRVEGSASDRTWFLQCDQVVNALWDGRLAIDRSMDIHPTGSWVHRLKYRVLVRLPPELRARPSVTYVLGAYGDVVVHPNGIGYISWYPECMQGWSAEVQTPTSWDLPCRGEISGDRSAAIAQRVLTTADQWFPGLAAAAPIAVDAGIIFAWGASDITDPASELHTRSKAGIRSYDSYHTIDTGKLTMAPFFAMQAANRVLKLASDKIHS